jgi:tRNA(fMet)-specific endonuclease VapC
LVRLIDTSVFIELERSDRPLDDILRDAWSEPIALASITAAELLVGVEAANSTARRQQRAAFVETILTHFLVFPLDIGVARVHARLRAELERSGRRVGPYDPIVAATAVTHGYDVLTLNIREFRQVPGLRVRTPAW